MRDIDRARSVYDGETLTSRWTIARSITPADDAVVRQAAREELQSIIEETAGHSGHGRIVRVGRKHIQTLQDQTQGATA